MSGLSENRLNRLKVKYENNLRLRNIFIDKLLIGAIVIIIGLFANNAIEDYKSDLSHERFLAERRLSALEGLSNSYSELSELMFYDVLSKYDLGVSFTERYIPKISDFAQLWNKHSMLFDADLDIEMQRFIWIHDAVAKREIDLTREHFKFTVAISERFDHITRKALWEGTLGLKSSKQEEVFEFVSWSTDDMVKKESIDFLIENWKKFSQE